MRLTLSLLATLTMIAPSAHAALVNIATNTLASPSRLVATSGGSVLPEGSIVRIGYFSGAIPVITPTTTFAQVNSTFVPIGENGTDAADGTNGPLLSTAVGGWAGTIQNVDNLDPRFAAATRLYIMVLDSSPAAMESAQNILIIGQSDWTIPSAGTRAMTTAQIDSQSEVHVGTWGAATLTMAPFNIPEPSVSAGAILVGLGLAFRRRR